MGAIAKLVHDAEQGDSAAATELFAALYRELHDLAERQLKRSAPDVTLGTTTLLHEAYLRLSQQDQARFPDRSRFLTYASKAMRRLIVDYHRARRARKRGGEFEIRRIGDTEPADRETGSPERLEQLSSALEQLAETDTELARLVDLHFFCGFSFVEIASLQGVSDRTVQRDWRKAKMLLRSIIGPPFDPDSA